MKIRGVVKTELILEINYVMKDDSLGGLRLESIYLYL